MSQRARFGPAGVPPVFRLMKITIADVPRLLQEEGLDAFEYEAVQWGRKPQVRREEAEKLGIEAKQRDVWLSLHGSYFLNFSGLKTIVEDSKQRLIACATAAEWMGAHTVVFHPGVYGKRPPEVALKMCSDALQDVVQTIRDLGITNVKLGPETMGKMYQLGSLDEVLSLCETVDQTQLVIDWSHLHARGLGRFRTVDDYRRIVEQIEKRLGTEALRNLHCHFSKIEYSDKGERRHHTLEEPRYGPDFRLLAKIIVEFKMNPILISESPVQDLDAIKMRDILREEMENT
jgi:deoxyribonuclease-4